MNISSHRTLEAHSNSESLALVLECARGFAALWVFLFHIAELLEKSSATLTTFARCGYFGVPLFFVISGYCMYAAASKSVSEERNPTLFLKRRFLRIFPPFWISLIVVVLVPFLLEAISALKSGAFSLPSPRWLEFGMMDWLQMMTLTRIFFNSDGDLQGAFSPVNAVYWTLAIEFQFYLVMYGALFFRQSWKKILILVFCISLFSGLAPNIRESGLFLPYWPAFSCGLILRAGHEAGFTPARVFGIRASCSSMLTSISLLAGILWAVFAGQFMFIFSLGGTTNAIFTTFAVYTSVLLWFLSGVEHSLNSHTRLSDGGLISYLLSPILLMGASSYSLYLLHGKIYQLPEMLIRQVLSQENIAYPILMVSATVLLCFAFYKLFETPFMSKRYTVRRKSSRIEKLNETDAEQNSRFTTIKGPSNVL